MLHVDAEAVGCIADTIALGDVVSLALDL